MGLLDYLNSGGLLNYDNRVLANQQAQMELDSRLNRDFTPTDYLLSSDPYTQAIKQNNLPERGLLSVIPQGINAAKNYVADMFSGQAPISHEQGLLDQQQAIQEMPVDERGEAIAENSVYNMLDWVPGGIIAGRHAKNANLKALEVAKKMKKQGYNKDEIFRATTDLVNYPNQTGWNLDLPDGQARFEILDDLKMKPINKWGWGSSEDFKAGNSTSSQASSFVENAPLDEAYPGILSFGDDGKRMTMGVIEDMQGGSYSGGHITVGAPKYTGDDLITANRKVTAHELQHPIQHIENFAQGGSPEMFKQEIIKDEQWLRDDLFNTETQIDNIEKVMQNLSKSDAEGLKGKMLANKYDELYDRRFEIEANLTADIDGEAFHRYKSLLGESEARLVPERLDYSMDERLLLPFYDNYDVPFEDMIIRRDGLLK